MFYVHENHLTCFKNPREVLLRSTQQMRISEYQVGPRHAMTADGYIASSKTIYTYNGQAQRVSVLRAKSGNTENTIEMPHLPLNVKR